MEIIESNEYDLFEYDNFNDQPLSLENAIRKSTELKKTDKSRFHRIVALDSSANEFKVSSVSREEMYSSWSCRAQSLYAKFITRARSRSGK